MGEHTGESGGFEEGSPEEGAIRNGLRARELVVRAARRLGFTWGALVAFSFLGSWLGFGGRQGVLPIMLISWVGFPYAILLGLGAQLSDLWGYAAWVRRRGFRGYLAATERQDRGRWLVAYPLFLVFFWCTLPLMIFCCFPVVC